MAVPLLVGVAGQLLSELAERETSSQDSRRRRDEQDGQTGCFVCGGYRVGGVGQYFKALKGPLGEPLQETLQCPGVDLEAYASACRAPIFRDHWNVWHLRRSTADGTTAADIGQKTEAFLSWLSGTLEGRIRHVSSVVASSPPADWKAFPYLGRELGCAHEASLRASNYQPPYFDVFARFVYRGVETDITWPALKIDTLVLHRFLVGCPVNADWLLETIYTPSSLGVPDVAKDSPLPPYLDPGNKLAGDDWLPDVDFSTKLVLGGGVLLVVGVLASYAIRGFR